MRQFIVLPALLALAFATADAQTTETPVSFDAPGRILSVSEALAGRLGLAAPGWPVTGPFIEARLFQSSAGGHVIIVQRKDGINDRYELTAEQAVALRSSFAAATDRVGRVVAEDAASLVAEPARGPFVRDQMLLATLLYGPAIASLTNDGATGSGAYLLSVGGTFFALTDMAKGRTISKAQNSMSTDGALRGWLFTAAALNLTGIDLGNHASAVTALAGGIGGSIAGYQMGKSLTNSEAQAAMTGSTLAAGTLLGLAGTTGILQNRDESGRRASAVLLIGGLGGYAFGPLYPRHASYTVTAGDISIVRLGAVLGSLAASTTYVGNKNIDDRAAAGIATAGWVAGALVADQIAARPFDHRSSDSRMVHLGALGGALMGLAFPVMARSGNATFVMAAGTGGAIAGAFLAQSMMDPPRQGTAYAVPSNNDASRFHLDFSPEALAMTVTKQRGNHSLVRITF